MAIHEHNEKDTEARMELSRLANLEISKLAEAAADICKDDDRPIFHGIMARIKTLSEIIFYAQKLHGRDEGDEPSTRDLERIYSGLLA
ncbi:hypothetical protein [Acidovorax sp. JHL-9]|uniref:hypothetical protein n=1 Tax=Acidovorax sp. JHL-9 TaxID=1276756 RepID=UPI0003FF552C|nr:hypothetical protein [Acidovorax sp. JHL-9]